MDLPDGMVLQFTFRNDGSDELYVNVELTPDRYLLRPGEELRHYARASQNKSSPTIVWHEGEVTVYPESTGEELTLINGENAEDRSWADQ